MKSLSVLIALFVAFGSLSNAYADKARLLIDDKEALQARVDLLQQAKTEILAEYFSVWNDDQSVGGFALLFEAAKRGVKVKVIMDAISNSVPKSVFDSLVERGTDAQGNKNIEIKLYNPLSINLLTATHRDHSKMLIVDGKRLITGGRNIGDKYFGLNKKRNFSDIDILVDGEAVVKARKDFMSVFNSDIVVNASYERNHLENLIKRNCNKPSSKDALRCESRRKSLINAYIETTNKIQKTFEDIIESNPGDIVQSHTNTDWLADVKDGAEIEFISHQPEKFTSKTTNDLTDALSALVGTTKKDLNILSPYLIPTKNMFLLLESLLKQGTRIRIVTNSLYSTDNLAAQAGYLHSKKRLIDMGIELYEYNGPDTAHGKAAVIDGNIVFVGTYNLDPRSAFLNREVGVFIKSSPDNEIAIKLTESIEEFRANSLLVGKDGVAVNVEEQDARMKKLGFTKRSILKLIQIFVPLFKNQI